jgi:hypothetical protein
MIDFCQQGELEKLSSWELEKTKFWELEKLTFEELEKMSENATARLNFVVHNEAQCARWF